MKNLQNYTKAELISKFKNLENKNNIHNSNLTLTSKVLGFILYYKIY